MKSLDGATVVDTEGAVFEAWKLPSGGARSVTIQVGGLVDGEVTVQTRNDDDLGWQDASSGAITVDETYVVDPGAREYRAVLTTANTGEGPVTVAFWSA